MLAALLLRAAPGSQSILSFPQYDHTLHAVTPPLHALAREIELLYEWMESLAPDLA